MFWWQPQVQVWQGVCGGDGGIHAHTSHQFIKNATQQYIVIDSTRLDYVYRLDG